MPPMLRSLSSIDKLKPWHYALLALFCLAIYLPGQMTLPPIDRDEARFAQASKQMVETGNYVDIRYQEETRYKKPIGIYWLQSATAQVAAALTGAQPNQIWAYRIPSLLAATGAVLVTAAIGELLFTPAIGLTAALLLASCLILNVEARLAKTDATLLLTVLLAQYALAAIWQKRTASTPHAVLFWLALGCGTLIKGPMVLLPTLPVLIGLCWRERSAAQGMMLWRNLRPMWGLPLYLLVVLPWLVAISIKSGGAFWQQSVGHDMMGKVAGGQESHAMPPLYYTVAFWATFWPGSILAYLAIPFVWRERRQEKIALLLLWLLPTWLLFELVPTKLPHYVLPTYPAIALLAATALHNGGLPAFRRAWLAAPGWIAWGIVSLGLIGGAVALPPLTGASLIILQLAAALVALALLSAWLLQRRIALLALASAAVLMPLFGATLPALQQPWIARQVQQATETAGCPTPELASDRFNEPSLVFTVGTQTKLDTGPEGAADFLAASRTPCRFALIDQSPANWAAFQNALQTRGLPPVEHLTSIDGFNYARGKKIELGLVRLHLTGDATQP